MDTPFELGQRNYKIGRCEFHREVVLKMASEGAYLAEIARVVGTQTRHIHAFLKRNGVDRKFPYTIPGPRCGKWKGGVRIDEKGYRLILKWDHPHHHKHTGYVYQHRLVMEEMIGRYLDPKEVVHHRDGNKLNNAPGNLQLFSENSEHLKHELTGKVPKWTTEGFANMCKPRGPRKDRKPSDSQQVSEPGDQGCK